MKKIFEIEEPTDQNIRLLLRWPWRSGRDELNFLLALSRTVAGHRKRMSDLMCDGIGFYIYSGDREGLRILLNAATEGGSLTRRGGKKLSERQFLRGDKWRKHQDNLIELIGFLRRCGLTREIAVLSFVKRGMKERRDT